MAGYILNSKKTFEIFVRTEQVLKSGRFQIMSEFEQEEIGTWKSFQVRSVDPMKCGIGWKILLIKQK